MTTDHSATTRGNEEIAATAVGGRQTSLAEHGETGRQTTRGGHAERVDSDTADESDLEAVNAFPMRDVLLVTHYFEGDGAFAALQPYYDQREYRFEIPQADLAAVQDDLEAHGYELRVVDYLEPYAVVVRKYSHHPESVFEDAVAQFSNADCNVFLLNDEAAVETAVRSGAQRLADAPVQVRFPAAHGTGPLTVADLTADD